MWLRCANYNFLLSFPSDVLGWTFVIPRDRSFLLETATVRARIYPVNTRRARGQTDSRYSLTTRSAGAYVADIFYCSFRNGCRRSSSERKKEKELARSQQRPLPFLRVKTTRRLFSEMDRKTRTRRINFRTPPASFSSKVVILAIAPSFDDWI